MHFQTWTAPEYYKQCAESLQKSKIEKEKERKLSERRERLQKMLETERHALNEELRILEQGHTNRRRDKKVVTYNLLIFTISDIDIIDL